MRKPWKWTLLIASFLLLISFGTFFLLTNKAHNPIKIGIVPFESISESDIVWVQNALHEKYGYPVVLLQESKLPASAFVNVKSPRYRADSLLHWLDKMRPDSVKILIGLTDKDISFTKYKKGTKEIKTPAWKYEDFGIFGLGRVNGNVAVVSTFRLKNGVGQEQVYKRLARIASHEIGHVLGLRHCPTKQCLMNDANESIKTIDKSTGDLCEKCLLLIP